MKVQVINLSNNKLPQYETPMSVGMDVRADFSRVTVDNPIKAFGDCEILFKSDINKVTMLRLDPGARALIPTGLKIALPVTDQDCEFIYECQVRPRSGLALKKGITILNTPGTIDADYRNEIGIIVINQGHEAVWIEDGERIAQLVFATVAKAEWEEVARLNETERKGGFGHTGEK
jgi:dUTP pyrophosphatase